MENYFCDSISNSFKAQNESSIIKFYKNALKFIKNKLNDQLKYHNSINIGVKSYHETEKGKQEFISIINNILSSTQKDQLKQGMTHIIFLVYPQL